MSIPKDLFKFLKMQHQNQQMTNNFDLIRMPSLTNNVYKVTIHKSNESYIFKQYRDSVTQFIDHRTQTFIIQKLAKDQLYPEIIQMNESCRLQKFIEGNTLNNQTTNFQRLYKIVKLLGKFSKQYTPIYQLQFPNYTKQRQIRSLFGKFDQIYIKMKKLEPFLIKQCESYIQSILSDKIRYKIQQIVPKYMVLSHNDSNLSNILQTKSGFLQLLDFQFCSMNYIGFDLGNLFNQFSTDYEKSFQIKQEWQIPHQSAQTLIKLYFQQIGIKVENQRRTMEIGRLLSHLFWLFVGVLQIGDKQVNLDMIYYIKRRHQQFGKYYHRLTDEML